MKTAILVQNLKCGGCAHTISTKLSEIKNISNLNIDIDEGKISFSQIGSKIYYKMKDVEVLLDKNYNKAFKTNKR